MGGPGSGSWIRLNTRRATDASAPLDVRELARKGALAPGAAFSVRWSTSLLGDQRERGSIAGVADAESVKLRFRALSPAGSWEEVRQVIPLERTPCTFGGERAWWTCPGCQRRAAVLFGAHARFQCRRCHRLAYPVENEGAVDRAFRRARRFRLRLGAGGDLLRLFPAKPKGMHWKTYARLFRAGGLAEARAWTWLFDQVGA